ncbi:MAG TPA: ABC transporter permease [Roseiflexaceae bacterium]|nr:ABC transporter permease [Roseiflexaceae bacterium]
MTYLLHRLLHLVGVWLGVLTLTFAIRPLAPGDPIAVLLFGQPSSPEVVTNLRAAFGLDRPLPSQYLAYLTGVARGDLGTSFTTRRPVTAEIGERFANTLLLTAISMALALILGVTIGTLSALTRGSLLDAGLMTLSLVGLALPSFWLGLLLIEWFAVRLHWLPVAGSGDAAHLVLPALTLALVEAAVLAHIARASLLEVLGQEYIRTAHAKGLQPRVVVVRHALRNALLPIMTVVGLQFGGLLGGALIVENIFAWPGLGQLAARAITQRDYPVIQGIVLLVATSYVLVNTIVDLLYAMVDPRVRDSRN